MCESTDILSYCLRYVSQRLTCSLKVTAASFSGQIKCLRKPRLEAKQNRNMLMKAVRSLIVSFNIVSWSSKSGNI